MELKFTLNKFDFFWGLIFFQIKNNLKADKNTIIILG